MYFFLFLHTHTHTHYRANKDTCVNIGFFLKKSSNKFKWKEKKAPFSAATQTFYFRRRGKCEKGARRRGTGPNGRRSRGGGGGPTQRLRVKK